MLKKIAIITTTRAEYGLLFPVITNLKKQHSKDVICELIVTGMHLSKQFGYTVDEIKNDNIKIDVELPIIVDSTSELTIAEGMADALVKFTALFLEKKYDAIMILGDRYEMLSIGVAASNCRIPIFHLYGGDTTEGALDEFIRHSITKMGYLHFVSNEESRNRVIQLGESPERVFNFGSTGIDNISHMSLLTKEDALKSIGLDNCKYILCTYHPVTLEGNSTKEDIYQFLKAIKCFPNLQFIVTKSNSDLGGTEINNILDAEEKKIENLHVFTSLGMKRYLSLMKYSEFVLGNSSSGLFEAPAFHIPTVNIGNRQQGRLQCQSIINCLSNANSICKAINLALSSEIKKKCEFVDNPFGDGNATLKIVNKSIEVLNSKINLKKQFYDLNFKDGLTTK